jgi:hypothetical protein
MIRLDLTSRISTNVVQKRVVSSRVQLEPVVRYAINERRVEDQEISSSDPRGDLLTREYGESVVVCGERNAGTG